MTRSIHSTTRKNGLLNWRALCGTRTAFALFVAALGVVGVWQDVHATPTASAERSAFRLVRPLATDIADDTASGAVTPIAPALISPIKAAYVATLTPTFTFTRATDRNGDLGEYAVVTTDAALTRNAFAFADPKNGETVHDAFTVTADASTVTVAVTTAGLFAEGAVAWGVTALDAAGNSVTTEPRTFTIDVTKPLLGSVVVAGAVSEDGASLKTVTRAPTLTSTLTDNLALDALSMTFAKRNFLFGQEIEPTAVFTQTAHASGTSSTNASTIARALEYGKYRVTFVTTDRAGNASAATRNIEVIAAGEVAPTYGADVDGNKRMTAPVVPMNGVPTAEEQRGVIENGGAVIKTPIDLTLPSLERNALVQRGRGADELRSFLTQFAPSASLDRFESRLERMVDRTNEGVVTAFQSVGSGIVRFFGFSKRHFTALGVIIARDGDSLRGVTAQAPLLAQLDRALPRFLGRSIIAVKTTQKDAVRWLVQSRRHRYALARTSEERLRRATDPILRSVRKAAMNVRVASGGIRAMQREPLALTDVQITEIDGRSAVISWKTNRAARGTVTWGSTLADDSAADSASGEVSVKDFTRTHTVRIEPLRTRTKYYVEVLAADSIGNEVLDGYYSFTTR